MRALDCWMEGQNGGRWMRALDGGSEGGGGGV